MRRVRPWLLLLLLAGCASTPLISLGPAASPDPLERQIALDAALNTERATPGNGVTILRDGRETFPAMFAAMSQATDHINLEYYIF